MLFMMNDPCALYNAGSPYKIRAVMLRKVPEVTLLFWIMKICATTLGETAGDLLSMSLKIGYAVSSLILIAAFLVTVLGQLKARKYHPWLYWLVILSTSTAGTTLSDFMDRSLGLGYAKGSALLLAALVAIFALWRATGESLSVDRIRTFRVELLYWTAILVSNTLGTALGDFLSDDSGLGFAGGALLIGSVLAATALVAASTKVSTKVSMTLLFWIAFVLTRPFGATMGDVLTKTRGQGGLDLGTAGSSLVLGSILVALIVYTSVRRT